MDSYNKTLYLGKDKTTQINVSMGPCGYYLVCHDTDNTTLSKYCLAFTTENSQRISSEDIRLKDITLQQAVDCINRTEIISIRSINHIYMIYYHLKEKYFLVKKKSRPCGCKYWYNVTIPLYQMSEAMMKQVTAADCDMYFEGNIQEQLKSADYNDRYCHLFENQFEKNTFRKEFTSVLKQLSVYYYILRYKLSLTSCIVTLIIEYIKPTEKSLLNLSMVAAFQPYVEHDKTSVYQSLPLRMHDKIVGKLKHAGDGEMLSYYHHNQSILDTIIPPQFYYFMIAISYIQKKIGYKYFGILLFTPYTGDWDGTMLQMFCTMPRHKCLAEQYQSAVIRLLLRFQIMQELCYGWLTFNDFIYIILSFVKKCTLDNQNILLRILLDISDNTKYNKLDGQKYNKSNGEWIDRKDRLLHQMQCFSFKQKMHENAPKIVDKNHYIIENRLDYTCSVCLSVYQNNQQIRSCSINTLHHMCQKCFVMIQHNSSSSFVTCHVCREGTIASRHGQLENELTNKRRATACTYCHQIYKMGEIEQHEQLFCSKILRKNKERPDVQLKKKQKHEHKIS